MQNARRVVTGNTVLGPYQADVGSASCAPFRGLLVTAEIELGVNKVLIEGHLSYLLQHGRVRQGYPMRQMTTVHQGKRVAVTHLRRTNRPQQICFSTTVSAVFVTPLSS